MYKRSITYTDFDGVERKETFYFNLSKAEITQLELETPGSFSGYIQQIIDAKSTTELIKLFKKFIDLSYGVKSPDGRRFIKNQEVLTEFKETEAYSEFFMDLVSNTDLAIEFMNGIMPQLTPEQQKEVDAKLAEYKDELAKTE